MNVNCKFSNYFRQWLIKLGAFDGFLNKKT